MRDYKAEHGFTDNAQDLVWIADSYDRWAAGDKLPEAEDPLDKDGTAHDRFDMIVEQANALLWMPISQYGWLDRDTAEWRADRGHIDGLHRLTSACKRDVHDLCVTLRTYRPGEKRFDMYGGQGES